METRVLGRYELLGELGHGGMGVVYRARHTQLGKTVALKILPQNLAESPTPLARFEREARAAANLDHPNIVQVFDVDQVGDTHFFAMEFVEGETLARRIRAQGTIAVAEAIRIARQIADALAFAHQHGVVHRDLKPANIMLDRRGQVKVMDFGIAAAVGTDTLTMTGEILGTPSYMSPEQALNQDVDGRSDLFSLGVTLCEMLTGRGPLEGLSVVSAVGKLIQPGQELELGLPPDLPPSLRAIVTRLVRKQPGERYGSAAELLADLARCETGEALMDVSMEATRAARLDQGGWLKGRWIEQRWLKRRWIEVGLAALVAANLGLLLWRAAGGRGDDRVQATDSVAEGERGTPPEVGPAILPEITAHQDSALELAQAGNPPSPPAVSPDRPSRGRQPAGARVPPPSASTPPAQSPPASMSTAQNPPAPPGPPATTRADSTRIVCEEARQEAQEAGAKDLAAESYGKAQKAEQSALAAYAAGRFEEAVESFAVASGMYRESRDQAKSSSASMARAREAMEGMRRRAEGEGAQTTDSFTRAQEKEKTFGAAMSDPRRAIPAAAQAESLYALSVLEHAADLSRKEVEEERARIREAPNRPEGAALRRAEEHERQAEAAYRAGRFAEAQSQFVKARDEFRLARARADRR
jgi:hypothetical protein